MRPLLRSFRGLGQRPLHPSCAPSYIRSIPPQPRRTLSAASPQCWGNRSAPTRWGAFRCMSTNPGKPMEEPEMKKDDTEPAAPGETPPKEEDSATSPVSSNTAAEIEGLLGYKTPEMLKNLPSQLESRRSEASKRFSKAMDDLQTAMFTAGRKLNDMTGYSEIEQLKKSIQQQENNVRNCRLGVQTAKESYQSAISRRSASQREVNELLQRKHAWSATDLERFTSLYRSDHANEQAELAASEQLAEAERTLDEAQTQLSRSILARYHEEQIWSDKIRRASTWGTWGLMGFNVLLFIIVQLGLEPWKRRRLVGGFEDKVREVIQEENMRQALMRAPLVEEEKALAAAAAAATPSAIQSPQDVATQTATETALAEAAIGEEILPEAETPATQADLEDVGTAVEEAEPVEMIPLHWMDPNTWIPGLMQRGQFVYGDTKKEVKNLFSDETVIITKNEMTLNSLQYAMLGAFVSALITLLWGRS